MHFIADEGFLGVKKVEKQCSKVLAQDGLAQTGERRPLAAPVI